MRTYFESSRLYYLWNDEFACEKTDGWERTVNNERERGPWVNHRVNVRQPLKPFQTTSITIPNRTMPTQENLNRPKCPSKNLMKTVRKIDGS